MRYAACVPVLDSIIKRRQGSWVELRASAQEPLKLPAPLLPGEVRIGQALSEELWSELRQLSEHHLLLDSALRMLARREHFTRELETKLRQRSPDKSRISTVLRECRERGYLDDARAAEALAESLLSRRSMGPGRLRGELFRRGCPPLLAEQTMQDYAERFGSSETLEAALELARRRFGSRAQKTLARMDELAATEFSAEAERGEVRQQKAMLAKEQRALRHKFAAQLSAFLLARGFAGDALRQGSSLLLAELLDQR